MDPDRAIADNLRSLCASAYVKEHLRADYIEETSLAATVVRECTAALHDTMQHFTAPGVDSFVSLFHEFGFNQLRPYNEAWSASAECIAHLRKTLQESNSRGLPLRGELSWAAIDKPFVPTIPEEVDIILSRKSKTASPVIGNSGTTKLDPRTLFPSAVPLHDDSDLPSLEQLICPPPTFDPALRAAVLSYLQANKVDRSDPRTFTFIEPPVSLLMAEDEFLNRPMSPPIFPRAPLKPIDSPALPQVIQKVVTPVPIIPFEPDLAQESMRIVNGWAVLVDPQSTPPPLVMATGSTGPASVDAGVDELECTPPPPSKVRAKRGSKGKGAVRKRRRKETKSANSELVKAVAVMSPPAERSLQLLEDMEVCPIPREHKVGHGRKTSLAGSMPLSELLQGLAAPVLQLDDKNLAVIEQNGNATAITTRDATIAPLLLPESLKISKTDVNAPILLERLEEADTVAPMQVPLLDSTLIIGAEKRSTCPSLHEILAKPAIGLTKVPLKALSLELSWKPVKLPKVLPTSLDLCGVMDPATVPGPVTDSKQLTAHYARSLALPDAASAVFVEPPPPDVSLGLSESYSALTRGERSRMLKRRAPPDDGLEYDEEDAPPPEKRQRISQSCLLLPVQRSDSPRHARNATFGDDDLVSTSQPADDQFVMNRLLSVDASRFHLSPPGASPVAAADDSSSISSLDDLMLVDFPTQTSSMPRVAGLQPMQHASAELSRLPAADRQLSPCVYDNDDAQQSTYPAPDEPHDDLADDITELLLRKSNSMHELVATDTTFSRFFRGRGRRLLLPKLAPAAPNPDKSGTSNQDPGAPTAITSCEPASFAIPANIVATLDPLFLSAADSARTDGQLHKYLVSNSFCQKREIFRALEALGNVQMVEREVLGTVPATPTNPDIHVQIDHQTCIVFLRLAELPARFNELLGSISLGASSCSNIVLIFECFVIRPSDYAWEGLVCDLGLHVFSPAVVKALTGLKHTVDQALTNVTVRYAFAETPEDAAKFVRLVGETAMTKCELETPELLDDLWGNRAWLSDEESEEEAIASTLPSLGRLAAILLLSRGCWDDWLDMKPGDRHTYLDLLFGPDRTDRFNAEIAEQVQLVLEEYHLSSPTI